MNEVDEDLTARIYQRFLTGDRRGLSCEDFLNLMDLLGFMAMDRRQSLWELRLKWSGFMSFLKLIMD